jgi:uncharacterized membrane protein
MNLRTAQSISLFLLILVTGVFWGTWFSLSRSIGSISPGAFLEIGNTMIHNLAWPMRILFPAALLSTIPVLVGLYRGSRGAGPGVPFYLTLCGVVLFVAALVITLLVNVPIDNQLIQWDPSRLPPDWEEIRDRWELFHALRTFSSLGGLALVLAGAVFAEARPAERRLRVAPSESSAPVKRQSR